MRSFLFTSIYLRSDVTSSTTGQKTGKIYINKFYVYKGYKIRRIWMAVSNAMGANLWTWTHICIMIFMCLGVLINGCAIIFLFRSGVKKTMFHRLLKILTISDLLVDIFCGVLWGLPRGWDCYSRYIFPPMAPYLFPISQVTQKGMHLLLIY